MALQNPLALFLHKQCRIVAHTVPSDAQEFLFALHVHSLPPHSWAVYVHTPMKDPHFPSLTMQPETNQMNGMYATILAYKMNVLVYTTVDRRSPQKLLMYLSNCIRPASYSANTFQILKVDTNKLPTYDTASNGTMRPVFIGRHTN